MRELKSYSLEAVQNKFKFLIGLLFFIPLNIYAAKVENTNPVAINMMTYVQVILGLIFVLGIFLLIAYLFKRISGDVYLNKADKDNRMKVLDSLSINTRDRILLIEVEKTPILISSASGRLEKLHVFSEKNIDENTESNT